MPPKRLPKSSSLSSLHPKLRHGASRVDLTDVVDELDSKRAAKVPTPQRSPALTAAPAPPLYTERPSQMTVHGHTRDLPFFYLRSPSAEPELRQLMEEENRYARRVARKRTGDGDFVKQLRREFSDRHFDTDAMLPVRRGNYYYYERQIDSDDGDDGDGDNDEERFDEHDVGGRSTSVSADDESGGEAETEEELGAAYFRVPASHADAWAAKRLKKMPKKPKNAAATLTSPPLSPALTPADPGEPCPTDGSAPSAAADPFPRDFIELCARTFAADATSEIPRHPTQEHQMLDLSLVCEVVGVPSMQVSELAISPDEKQLAACLDWSSGLEEHSILVFDIGSHFPKAQSRAQNCGDFCEWGNDSTFYFVTKESGTGRSHIVVKSDISHLGGTIKNKSKGSKAKNSKSTGNSKGGPNAPIGEESEVLRERDPAFEITAVRVTEDSAYLVIESASNTSTESHIVARADPSQTLRLFLARQPGVRYQLTHYTNDAAHGGPSCLPSGFVFLVFDTCAPADSTPAAAAAACAERKSGIYFCADGADPLTESWPLLSLEGCDPFFSLLDVDIRREFFLVTVRSNGFQNVVVIDLRCPRVVEAFGSRSRPLKPADLPDVASVLSAIAPPSCNLAKVHTVTVIDSWYGDSSSFFVAIENMVVPEADFRVTRCPAAGDDAGGDASSTARFIFKQVNGYTPRKFHIDRYAQDLRWAPLPTELPIATPASAPGIPIAMCCDKTVPIQASERPLWLHVYGSYGDCSDPEFDSNRLSLLHRGVVYAIAGVRGGGDLGQIWRLGGNGLNRLNAAYDTIAAVEYLIAAGLCHPGKVILTGDSAAGMIIGTCVNLRPELFAAVHARVPFVDVLSTMLDETAPLTAGEWSEWGNPVSSKTAYEYMLKYSPTDCVPSGDADVVFPNILIESGWADARVKVVEPATWCALLRRSWDASAAAGRVLVHKCSMDSGHEGGDDDDADDAFAWAMLLSFVGIEQ